MNSSLLDDAIADAKAVRATALANAKAALEEAFAEKFKSMQTMQEPHSIFIGKLADSIRHWLPGVNALDKQSLDAVNSAIQTFVKNNLQSKFEFVIPEGDLNGSIRNYVIHGKVIAIQNAEYKFLQTCSLPAILEFDEADLKGKSVWKRMVTDGYFYLTGEMSGGTDFEGNNLVSDLSFTGLYFRNEKDDSDQLLLPEVPF